MDAAQRELNDQIDHATQRLLDDARTIPEAELRAPSLLPGWTRAHVLAHVARNADAMRNLLIGARSGQDRAAYASAQAREADIERGAAMGAKDLIADLADSSMALRTIVKQLPDEAWRVRVRVLDSAPFPAAELLTRRLVEVELHHCDLGVGYSSADWPAVFVTMELAEPMRSQRQDRLGYPPPSPETKPAVPGRPLPPWKPGQRLPGSWLGTGGESKALPTSCTWQEHLRVGWSKVSADVTQGELHVSSCGEAISAGWGACLDQKLGKVRVEVRADRSRVDHRYVDHRHRIRERMVAVAEEPIKQYADSKQVGGDIPAG
jgi:maleylpyruvate isomerase